MPDTFFRNEKEGRLHDILVPNVYVRIFPDGLVLYSIRYQILPSNFKTKSQKKSKMSLWKHV